MPDSNKTDSPVRDEEVFVSSIVSCIGAIIGIVVCQSEQSAQRAAQLIRIDYEVLTPVILTIEDAINHQSYFGDELCLRQGDVDKGLADAEHTLKGTVWIGGQEHFYLETNCCVVIPSNDDREITVHLATQKPSVAQELVALALGREVSQVICHVKRVGGAFGGKGARA